MGGMGEGSEDTLHLRHGKHASEEAIAGVVATCLVAQHGAAVVHTEGKRAALGLKDATQFYQVGTPAKMTGFREVAVGEDMAGTKVNEVGARCELARHVHHVIISPC